MKYTLVVLQVEAAHNNVVGLIPLYKDLGNISVLTSTLLVWSPVSDGVPGLQRV